MTVKVEFQFDFGSPNAYLSHVVIPSIEARTGVDFVYVPVLLGGVFKATGNVSPMVSTKGILNKAEFAHLEMRRFLNKHGITDFRINPHFPLNTLALMRGAVFARSQGYLDAYVDTVFRQIWTQGRKMDDAAVFVAALDEAGLPGNDILAGAALPEVKQELIANVDAAVARGVFGSPSFFVGDELFFGKDQLRDVEDEIRRQQG